MSKEKSWQIYNARQRAAKRQRDRYRDARWKAAEQRKDREVDEIGEVFQAACLAPFVLLVIIAPVMLLYALGVFFYYVLGLMGLN